MLRIMIVDDEPNIVEGLYHLIQSMDTEGLDVSKAYSGREALALIREAPVDLVLSDIRMPGMSGLQLLSAIEEYWPSCRIVFLTGYGEFDYIHTAIKSPQCTGYLLKTEGDEIIIDTMRREIGKINEQKEHSTLLARAREQMTAMLSLLREQYLRLLVTEGSQANGPAGFDGSELKLRIDPCKPMLAAVGWLQPSSQMGYLERTRLVLAIDEAIADAFGSHATREFAMLDEGMAVWLLQNGSWAQGSDPATGPVESFAGYVGAGLQLVQNNVRQIGATVSFALSSGAVGVEELPLKVHALQTLAIGMGAAGSEMIIHEQQAEAMLPPGGEAQAAQHQRFPLQLRRL
jgi:two-component system, response regulator YesN